MSIESKYITIVHGNTLVLNRPALNADGLKDKEIFNMPAEEQEKIVSLVYTTLAKANAGDYTHIVSTDLHDFASRAKALKEQPAAQPEQPSA